MSDCIKCGSSDISTKYIPKRSLINSSSLKKMEDEFITSSEYDYFYQLTARIEHLRNQCNRCKYVWRENVINSTSA